MSFMSSINPAPAIRALPKRQVRLPEIPCPTGAGILLAVLFLMPSPLWVEAQFSPLNFGPVDTNRFPNARPPRSTMDLRFWLQNMVWYHRFTTEEMSQALGMEPSVIEQSLKRYSISEDTRPERDTEDSLVVLPYPGGRHPRIGFLEGAINPQRETKLSVFLPWSRQDYVVLDMPEAIWSNLGLTYLAHTHIPTVWTKDSLELRPLEWKRRRDGGYSVERTLPNGIKFSTEAIPTRESVLLEMKLFNGTTNTLTDLRVQNCLLLKGAAEFNQQTNRNKIFASPFAACRSSMNDQRWIIYGWQPCHRTWANAPCPCLHSDPKFPDCPPGQSLTLRGWLSFYEGKDLEAELRRIEEKKWLNLTTTGDLRDPGDGAR